MEEDARYRQEQSRLESGHHREKQQAGQFGALLKSVDLDEQCELHLLIK